MIGGLILLLRMSIPSLNLPQNTHDQPLASLPPSLEQVLFAPLRAALEGSDFTRGCCVIDDLSFATLCVRRVLQSSKSGRDFFGENTFPGPFESLTLAGFLMGLVRVIVGLMAVSTEFFADSTLTKSKHARDLGLGLIFTD
jgi:hypothetical protein